MDREDIESKPLSKHTKYNYYECLAKIVLEETFPERYTDLLISDKPDLQCIKSNTGIEVTIAQNYKQLECEAYYSKILFNPEKDPSPNIRRIEKLGAKYNNGSLDGMSGKDDFLYIEKAIEIKLEKLNDGGYKEFTYNCLFIFSDIYSDEKMLNLALYEFVNKQNYFDKKFHRIYIYVPLYLYIFDFNNKNVDVLNIKKHQFLWAVNSRAFVLENELKVNKSKIYIKI